MELTENTAITDNHLLPAAFTPKDVLDAFDVSFLDEHWCRIWILMKLHPVKACCPGCRNEIPERLQHSFWNCKRIKCDTCGKYFTVLTGTTLSGCHFDFREIVLLSLLIALGIADKQIATILKISAENVRLWRHRFDAIAQAQQKHLENNID